MTELHNNIRSKHDNLVNSIFSISETTTFRPIDIVGPSMESHFGQKRSSFSRTVDIFVGRSIFLSDGRDFCPTNEIFLGRLRLFSDGRDFSRTVEIFLGQSRFFSDGRYFSRTVETLQGRVSLKPSSFSFRVIILYTEKKR